MSSTRSASGSGHCRLRAPACDPVSAAVRHDRYQLVELCRAQAGEQRDQLGTRGGQQLYITASYETGSVIGLVLGLLIGVLLALAPPTHERRAPRTV